MRARCELVRGQVKHMTDENTVERQRVPQRAAINRRVITWKSALLVVVFLFVAGCSNSDFLASRVSPNANSTPPQGFRSVANDGGAGFYASFKNPLPDDSRFFPIGVWHESVLEPANVALDRSAGINTYVELTPNSDLQLAIDQGSFALSSTASSLASGVVLPDEVDMWGKAGNGVWTGNWPGEGPICKPEADGCGYTVMKEALGPIPQGVMTYANFGKGVTFWTDSTVGSRFVSDFAEVVSADNYWFTDPNICSKTEGGTTLPEPVTLSTGECRLAANYGWSVRKIRSLVKPAGSKPVWGFVEVAHPFTDEKAPTIKLPEIRAAVWSSIIAGARGIVYFNHSFAGPCASQHVLRDCGPELREGVAEINKGVRELAPVINAPSAEGLLQLSGNADVLVKVHAGDIYVFAGSSQAKPQAVTFNLQCLASKQAEVLGEGRMLSAGTGAFTDEFSNGNAIHIYRFSGNSCGL